MTFGSPSKRSMFSKSESVICRKRSRAVSFGVMIRDYPAPCHPNVEHSCCPSSRSAIGGPVRGTLYGTIFCRLPALGYRGIRRVLLVDGSGLRAIKIPELIEVAYTLQKSNDRL